jgi:hypothetical protein
MGLFKRKKNEPIETEICIVDEELRNIWNVFNKVPWRVTEHEGEEKIELVWIALNSWEEKYLQYAWVYKNKAIIEDRPQRLLIEPGELYGFTYKDVKVYKCRKIIVPSWNCNEFGCKALLLQPEGALKRLWRLYEKYIAKKIGSV